MLEFMRLLMTDASVFTIFLVVLPLWVGLAYIVYVMCKESR